MSDLIQCRCCGGTGTIKLTGVHADTLKGLRKLSKRPEGFAVANIHAVWFGCKPTALNNRLRWLEENGFATSVRYGQQRRYRAK